MRSKYRGSGQAKDAQATECFVWPLNAVDFIGTVRNALSMRVEESWKSLDPLQADALASCATTMRTCFSQCRNGQDLPLDAVRNTTEKIAAAAGDTPLETWLGSIEHYHDYTFTHCMFVCFTIIAFGESIGIKDAELAHLTLGALLHDIGKSRVPIAILDKPAKLDADEWRIMKQHRSFRGKFSRRNKVLRKIRWIWRFIIMRNWTAPDTLMV
jgi:response regulator RpfG family c-di-GMP phosphodiesterase